MSYGDSLESCVLDAVFDGVSAGLCLLDPDGRVLRANSEWVDGALLTGQEVVGRSIWELLPDAPVELRRLHDQARRGGALDVPRRAFGQTGREPWHTSKLTPVPFADGVGILVTSFHGAGRTPSEEVIRARDDRLRAVLDTMLEGCQLVSHDWRYLYVNNVAAAQNRCAAEDLIGHTMMEIYPELEKTPVFEALQRCMVDRTPQRLQSAFRFPDGKVAWFELSVEPQPDGIFILSVDITERKRAERAHRTVRDQLAAIVASSPVPIIAADDQLRILLWSSAAERLFGWSSDDAVGRKIPQLLVPPDRREDQHQLLAGVIHGDSVSNFVTRRVGRDGRQIPVSISAAPLRDEAGVVKGSVSILTDLTQQTALRAALVESESRFAAAFEATPLAKVMIRVGDGIIVEVNRACLGVLGVKREDVIGQPHSKLPIERTVSTSAGFWSRIERDGRVDDYEVKLRPRGKAERDALLSAERIAMGGEQFVLVVMQDVTQRKDAELALKESNALFRQLAETIEEVFWLTDAREGTMVYVSPAYEQIWGRSCQSLYETPHDWIDAIHPADRERILDAWRTKQVLGTYDEEYRIVRPDGETRWIRDRGFPVRAADGTVIRIAGSAQDITSRRALEEQLRQTQKMESIGLLAGGVAHDFNNVLTAIAGTCDALGDLLPPQRETHELLDEIRKAGERASALTRQLLSFSRREVIEIRVVDLAGVVADTKKMLSRILGEDVLLDLSLGREPTWVKVDPGSWSQVLLNLAINARDAMPRGGKLGIETRAVSIHPNSPQTRSLRVAPGRYVVLSVTDDGIGMSAEVKQRVFEPFYTTKGIGMGTGLGLSVVHGIVAQSGGTIEVVSEVGKGTTFNLYLPSADAPSEIAKPIPRDRDSSGSETILVVEDEPAIRRVVIRALTKLGYAVLHAGNGVEALAVVSEHAGPINLLVTDVVMPHMDGRELAEALLARYTDLRVLYTSGYTDDAVMRHGIQHAEVAFLAKPYDLSSLRQKVRDVLDNA